MFVLRIVQANEFYDKITSVRVEDRLQNLSLSFAKKNPIILDAKSYFCKLLVKDVHDDRYFQAGEEFVMSVIKAGYHNVGGLANFIKFLIRTCAVSTRFKKESVNQLRVNYHIIGSTRAVRSVMQGWI